MGAGRGQLSHELHACLKDDSTVNFVLIERGHQRYRYDAHHRRECQGPIFERYRLDIRDLYLSELPAVQNPQQQMQIVIISKHLCGRSNRSCLTLCGRWTEKYAESSSDYYCSLLSSSFAVE